MGHKSSPWTYIYLSPAIKKGDATMEMSGTFLGKIWELYVAGTNSGAFFGRTFKLWDWPKTATPMFVERLQKEWTDNYSGTQKFLFSAPQQKGSTPSPLNSVTLVMIWKHLLLWRLWRSVIDEVVWNWVTTYYNQSLAPCNRMIWIVNPVTDL